MSRDASVTLECWDGSYHFRLGWGEFVLIQEEANAGPYVILGRLTDGTWWINDISSIIRAGLIGGGMPSADALKLVNTNVKLRPPMENIKLAQAVLSAGLIGAEDEDSLGKRKKGLKDKSLDDLPNGKIRFAELYKMGAKMGLTPKDLNEMSIFQYLSFLEGWLEANIVEEGLSANEQDELWEWLKTKG